MSENNMVLPVTMDIHEVEANIAAYLEACYQDEMYLEMHGLKKRDTIFRVLGGLVGKYSKETARKK